MSPERASRKMVAWRISKLSRRYEIYDLRMWQLWDSVTDDTLIMAAYRLGHNDELRSWGFLLESSSERDCLFDLGDDVMRAVYDVISGRKFRGGGVSHICLRGQFMKGARYGSRKSDNISKIRR